MNDFELFIKTGLWHIADITAYDHIIFIIALCASYFITDWRKIIVLITAFTVGHSVTLALSVLNIVVFPANIIELLIPITIMLTSVFNIRTQEQPNLPTLKYALALFFGFIHGCGFSNYLKTLLGHDENIWFQLFSFNIGIELGQLLIIAIALLVTYIATQLFHVEQSKWKIFISGATFGVALSLFINLLTQNN
jgi:HupE / UreJ protein